MPLPREALQVLQAKRLRRGPLTSLDAKELLAAWALRKKRKPTAVARHGSTDTLAPDDSLVALSSRGKLEEVKARLAAGDNVEEPDEEGQVRAQPQVLPSAL